MEENTLKLPKTKEELAIEESRARLKELMVAKAQGQDVEEKLTSFLQWKGENDPQTKRALTYYMENRNEKELKASYLTLESIKKRGDLEEIIYTSKEGQNLEGEDLTAVLNKHIKNEVERQSLSSFIWDTYVYYNGDLKKHETLPGLRETVKQKRARRALMDIKAENQNIEEKLTAFLQWQGEDDPQTKRGLMYYMENRNKQELKKAPHRIIDDIKARGLLEEIIYTSKEGQNLEGENLETLLKKKKIPQYIGNYINENHAEGQGFDAYKSFDELCRKTFFKELANKIEEGINGKEMVTFLQENQVFLTPLIHPLSYYIMNRSINETERKRLLEDVKRYPTLEDFITANRIKEKERKDLEELAYSTRQGISENILKTFLGGFVTKKEVMPLVWYIRNRAYNPEEKEQLVQNLIKYKTINKFIKESDVIKRALPEELAYKIQRGIDSKELRSILKSNKFVSKQVVMPLVWYISNRAYNPEEKEQLIQKLKCNTIDEFIKKNNIKEHAHKEALKGLAYKIQQGISEKDLITLLESNRFIPKQAILPLVYYIKNRSYNPKEKEQLVQNLGERSSINDFIITNKLVKRAIPEKLAYKIQRGISEKYLITLLKRDNLVSKNEVVPLVYYIENRSNNPDEKEQLVQDLKCNTIDGFIKKNNIKGRALPEKLAYKIQRGISDEDLITLLESNRFIPKQAILPLGYYIENRAYNSKEKEQLIQNLIKYKTINEFITTYNVKQRKPLEELTWKISNANNEEEQKKLLAEIKNPKHLSAFIANRLLHPQQRHQLAEDLKKCTSVEEFVKNNKIKERKPVEVLAKNIQRDTSGQKLRILLDKNNLVSKGEVSPLVLYLKNRSHNTQEKQQLIEDLIKCDNLNEFIKKNSVKERALPEELAYKIQQDISGIDLMTLLKRDNLVSENEVLPLAYYIENRSYNATERHQLIGQLKEQNNIKEFIDTNHLGERFQVEVLIFKINIANTEEKQNKLLQEVKERFQNHLSSCIAHRLQHPEQRHQLAEDLKKCTSVEEFVKNNKIKERKLVEVLAKNIQRDISGIDLMTLLKRDNLVSENEVLPLAYYIENRSYNATERHQLIGQLKEQNNIKEFIDTNHLGERFQVEVLIFKINIANTEEKQNKLLQEVKERFQNHLSSCIAHRLQHPEQREQLIKDLKKCTTIEEFVKNNKIKERKPVEVLAKNIQRDISEKDLITLLKRDNLVSENEVLPLVYYIENRANNPDEKEQLVEQLKGHTNIKEFFDTNHLKERFLLEELIFKINIANTKKRQNKLLQEVKKRFQNHLSSCIAHRLQHPKQREQLIKDLKKCTTINDFLQKNNTNSSKTLPVPVPLSRLDKFSQPGIVSSYNNGKLVQISHMPRIQKKKHEDLRGKPWANSGKSEGSSQSNKSNRTKRLFGWGRG
ncbi:hypothetical protein [Abyssalbus ytuae]|uniref:Uncharacterized protein n=1 Tax=Abyssalbus ytuae TaxID=2926907 RepID=A0A9E7D3X0_9FLAO|nr:hypothetical protein [Abyssalbus ytuae]UOB18279.1 hypothetical protein MQE35_03065 [Abyssalbus ytuae]